jgi:hypothetical protein
MVLTHNRFGPVFLKNVLRVIKEDNYLRVLDLRKNRFTSAVLADTANYDFIKLLQ